MDKTNIQAGVMAPGKFIFVLFDCIFFLGYDMSTHVRRYAKVKILLFEFF